MYVTPLVRASRSRDGGSIIVPAATKVKSAYGGSNMQQKVEVTTARDFESHSSISTAPVDFDRYFIRSLMSHSVMSEHVGDAMCKLGTAMLEADSTLDIDYVTDYVEHKAGLPTLLSDMYRALIRPQYADGFIRDDATSTASKLFSAYVGSHGYRSMCSRTNGNPSEAAVGAVAAFNQLVSSVFTPENVKKDMEQQAEQEQHDADSDSDGDGNPTSDSGDTESNNSDGDGDGQADEQASDTDGGSGSGGGGDGDGDESGAPDTDSESGDESDADSESGQQQDEPQDATPDSEPSTAKQKLSRDNPYKQEAEQASRPPTQTASDKQDAAIELADELSMQDSAYNYGRDQKSQENIANVETLAKSVVDMVDNGGVNHNVEAVMSVLGRTDSLLGDATMASKHGDGEVVDVAVGADTSRMIASEFVMLAIDELEPLYYTRMAEEQLLMTERRGVDDGGNGPLFVMVDISGSASDCVRLDGKTPTIRDVEFSLSLSLARFAKKWHRPIIIMPFNTGIYPDRAFVNGVVGMSAKTASKTHANITNCIGISTCGGTNFNSALAEAVEYIKKLPASFKDHCDILYLTDGEDSYSSRDNGIRKEQSRMLEDNGIRLFGFVIRDASCSDSTLKQVQRSLSNFFHGVVVSRSSELAAGITELFSTVIAASFYEVDGKKM